MKNTVQISGLLTALLLLIGNVFKTFHWPGAALIITLSIILFVFGSIFMCLLSNSPRGLCLIFDVFCF